MKTDLHIPVDKKYNDKLIFVLCHGHICIPSEKVISIVVLNIYSR